MPRKSLELRPTTDHTDVGPVSAGWCNRYSVFRGSLRVLGVIRSDLAEPAYSTRCLSVHEVKLLYVRYDAQMNVTDVWEDMNMICRYIDEVHTYTIGCGLHNMSIYIRRYSFEAPPNN